MIVVNYVVDIIVNLHLCDVLAAIIIVIVVVIVVFGPVSSSSLKLFRFLTSPFDVNC